MFAPKVFTPEPAAEQLGHQLTEGKGGTAGEQTEQTEQNSRTGSGESACHMLALRLRNKIISFSLPIQTKLAILEEKLLKEERERLLVQEKADQVSASFSLEQSSPFIFHKKHQDEGNVWVPHSCRISWA